MIENVTVGTDAEVAVLLVDGTPFPATGLVAGTKEKPAKLGRLGEGFGVQVDGVNLEFNIPPCRDMNKFFLCIQKAQKEMDKVLPPTFFLDWNTGTHLYKREFLKHPAAARLGCDPDTNIWTMEENPVPDGESTELRSAAAHIHVGWSDPTNEDRAALVKALDLFLGYKFSGIDDRDRKKLYGKAGAFRSKPYGIEYRVLSNFWLSSFIGEVWEGVERAVEFVNLGETIPDELVIPLQEMINEGKYSAALDRYCRHTKYISRY